MKTILKFLAVVSFVFTIQSCDFVTNPIEGTSPTDTTASGVVVRKVLIEDYTGHKCTNCPQAATTANGLIQSHGDKVVIMGVHAGFFASPATGGTNYLTDFRTTAGNTYNTFFNFQAYPNGLINRKYYPVSTNTYIIPHGSWATETAIELAKPATAKIEITNTYNSTSKILTCDVKSTFLFDTLTGGPYKLVVAITQDSIIATQLDGVTIVTNYLHRHVLRDNINGAWGENITTVPVAKNTPITKTFNYTFPSTYPAAGGTNASACVVKNCHVVAYLYNDLTKEVIQVEEKEVIH